MNRLGTILTRHAMRGLKLIWKELTAAIFFTVVVGTLLVWVPIGSTYRFGADEGYEVMKAFLVHEGWQLYDPIWNDQPPLLTFLLAGSFELFGVSIFVARLVVVLFTGLLLASLSWLLARHSGAFAATFGPALLALWPDFLKFGVSVMQIVPMMAMGLFGTALFCRALERDRIGGFLASGAVLGLGLGIKLTTALFFPVLAVEWLIHFRGKSRENRLRHWLHGIAMAVAASTVFMTILLMTPTLSFEALLTPHFSPTTYREASASPPGELLHLLFTQAPLLVITTGLGVVLLLARRAPGANLPIGFLATVFLVHSIHRPFWYYYDLHFALPLAWITALAIGGLGTATLNADWHFHPFPWRGITAYLGCSLLLALSLAEMWSQWRTVTAQITYADSRGTWQVAEAMAEYRDRVDVVAAETMAAFHARLPVIPELAVNSSKRQLAGLIDAHKTWAIIRNARPGLIQLRHLGDEPETIRRWLADNYRKHEKIDDLLVRRDLPRAEKE